MRWIPRTLGPRPGIFPAGPPYTEVNIPVTAAVARSEFGVPNLAPWTETKGHQQIVMTRPLWQKDDCGMALVVLRPGRRVEMKA
jgi:hypothetical protein